MTIKAEDITSALKKLGRAVSPGELAEHLEVERSVLAYHLKPLLDDGTVVATGTTNSRRIGLPGQKADDTTTPQTTTRKAAKKGKTKAAKKGRKAKAPRAPKKEDDADGFIPAIDATKRLVIINGTDTLIFERAETQKIADLINQFFKA